jgi:tetratricopeptide (TPR) repeat protein
MQRAEALAASSLADPALVGRVRALQTDRKQDEADRRMVARVEEIRLSRAEQMMGVRAVIGSKRPAYEAAFKEYGLPVFDLDVEEAARRIVASPIRDWLVAALDDCAENDGWLTGKLIPIVQRVEKDKSPWVRAYYDARLRQDGQALLRLAKQPEALQQPPITLCMLALLVAGPDRNSAIALLRQAQVRHPADLWINHHLANHLLDSNNDVKDAITFRRVALAARPDSPALRILLAAALVQSGNAEEARAHYQQATAHYQQLAERRPDSSVYLNLGVCLWLERPQAKQDLEEVIVAFRKAIAVAPNSALAYAHLAAALQTRGDSKAAADAERHVVELEPVYAHQVFMMTGLALPAPGAIAVFRMITRLEPKDALARNSVVEAHYALGQYLQARGNLDDAIREFEACLRMEPSHRGARHQLFAALRYRATQYANLGESGKALADFTRAIEIDPKDAKGWGLRAGYHTTLKRWDQAIADSTKAIDRDPKSSYAFALRAVCYRALKQWEKAAADLSKVIELDPKHLSGRTERATCYEELKHWDKAIADYSKV